MSQAYFPSFNIKFTDTNGQPLSSGKLYAFYSDGITPAPTYNQAGNPNAHPIILDASGECQLKGDDSISYTFKSYTSGNALVATWVGVAIPAGGSGSTVTMDTIAQGTAYKKITSAQYTALTGGANTTLHYHSADRAWTNISGKPSTFTPSAHAASHAALGSDALDHDSLGPKPVSAVATYGHISGASQDIYGAKRFMTSPLTIGDSSVGSSIRCFGNNGGQFDAQAGSYTTFDATVSVGATTGAVLSGATKDWASVTLQTADNTVTPTLSNITAYAFPSYAYTEWKAASGEMIRLSVQAGYATIYIGTAGWTSDEPTGSYRFASKEWVETGYAYNHTQGTAAVVWTINHGKSYFPIIQCVDSSNAVVNGSIQHYSGYATVTFAFATSGTARAV